MSTNVDYIQEKDPNLNKFSDLEILDELNRRLENFAFYGYKKIDNINPAKYYYRISGNAHICYGLLYELSSVLKNLK